MAYTWATKRSANYYYVGGPAIFDWTTATLVIKRIKSGACNPLSVAHIARHQSVLQSSAPNNRSHHMALMFVISDQLEQVLT